MQDWSIRDAKDHLGELVDAAQDEPQVITRRDRRAVIFLSEEFDRLGRRKQCLSEFFARAGFEDVEIERTEAAPREHVDL
ncbi:MAG TPA: type II toxin-antitoxin system Phd/YefM family antitoxin [Stellaceae bacterium]|jgi:prevent-host-death family protein